MTQKHAVNAATWMAQNPDTLALFLKLAQDAKAAGCSKTSIWLIAGRVRWEYVVVRRGGDDYKINNNYLAYIARELIRLDPRLDGLFDFRSVG